MQIIRIHICALVAVAAAFSASGANAAEGQTNTPMVTEYKIDDNFTKGWHEATTGIGVMLSPGYFSHEGRPTVNYVTGFGQAGYMLSEVRGDSFLRGNFEFTPEFFASAIWEDTGNYIVGGTLWARYNFVPTDWKVVPYLQLGGGVVLTDIAHKYDGQNFNFNLDIGGGVRYFVQPRLSLNLEYRFQHISNANTGNRNIGINATGPVFGVSWFF